MTTRRRTAALLALPLAAAFGLAGCSVIDNVVGGAGDAVTGAVQNQVDDLISQALGGAQVSTDGELPAGLPDLPITGTVEGGAAGPDGAGWVVRTTLDGSDYAAAAQALKDAGFTAAIDNGDATSGFGQFTDSADLNVTLFVTTEGGATTATYIVIPATSSSEG